MPACQAAFIARLRLDVFPSRLQLPALPALLTDDLGEVAMVVVLNGRYSPLVRQAPPQ